MTVSAVFTPALYTSTGVTNTYSFSFYVFQAAHLLVRVKNPNTLQWTTLSLSTDGTSKDYTVAGVQSTTGSVTLLSNGQAWMTAGFLTSGWQISILLKPPNTQLANVRGENRFSPEIHENEFDLLVMMDQYIAYIQSQIQTLIVIDGWLSLPALTVQPASPSSGIIIYLFNGILYGKSAAGTVVPIATISP